MERDLLDSAARSPDRCPLRPPGHLSADTPSGHLLDRRKSLIYSILRRSTRMAHRLLYGGVSEEKTP